MQRKPIFYDERQRRWKRTRRLLEIGGVLFTALLFVFLFSVLKTPDLPGLLLPQARPALHAVRTPPRAKQPPRRPGRRYRVAALGNVPHNYDPLRAAFYVGWDSTSMASLRQHYRGLDLLIPELLHAVSADGRLDADVDVNLLRWLRGPGADLPTMALVNNFDGTNWRTSELAQLLRQPESRRRLKNDLVRYAATTRQAGIVVDFEEIPLASQAKFAHFIEELAGALHHANLKLMVALPAADPEYPYAAIGAAADAVILMNYDQHWLASPPGPIAAQDWFVHNLQEMLRQVPAGKLVLAIGNYAYDWTENPSRQASRRAARQAHAASFQQAIVTAQESEAFLEFDSDSLNPHYSYSDENQRTHQVWMLDAITAYNETRAADRSGVRGTVLWRLGSEDPSLWAIWDNPRPDDAARTRMREIPPGYDLVLEAEGDIWRVTATPQKGSRELQYDAAADAITGEKIVAYPMPYRIDQLGSVPGAIALTFDDGPDGRFTPRILDVLKEKNATATFFITGLVAGDNPALLRRMFAEGHEIGNHTYTHPHFDEISPTQLEIELNLTQRLLESRLGVKSVLFRPPYGIDHQPESADEVRQLPAVQDKGYLIVGSKIDPHDWGEPGGGAPPAPEVIAERVLQQARHGGSHIVLLHDGGGDRSHTVAALPGIIDGLRAGGFRLVPVSALVGMSRAQVMPPVSGQERWLARADAFFFNLFHFFRLAMATIFIAGIALVSARAFIVGIAALVEKLLRRRERLPGHASFSPRASIVIPAYNEEDSIVETVRAALASDYPDFEVVVVNDGSRDRTGHLLDEHFSGNPRVRIFHQANQGKPAALNLAIERAAGEVIITIDADTTVAPGAVRLLVRHFADPKVGAVAGNAKVGNRTSWLTRWQALEYITSQNLEKRAFDLLNCITVVPGAVGAWRAQAVRAAGGFHHDTLAEDTDLTLTLRRSGWRIRYDEDAIGRTRAPENAGTLVRQRFRWTFGTMQAVWKHADTFGRPRYGTMGSIALPNILVFQILLPLVSPIIDFLFLGSIALWALAQAHVAQIPALWTTEDVTRSVVFFAAFMVIDFLTCVLAFALERREDWTLLLPLLLQRFYYRQMMYLVLFGVITRAVQGRAVGWGRVEPLPKAV